MISSLNIILRPTVLIKNISQLNREILLALLSCGLVLFGALLSMKKEELLGIVLFSLPGVLLAVYLVLKRFLHEKSVTPPAADDSANQLLKWHQLREAGAISNEEFQKKKNEILG